MLTVGVLILIASGDCRRCKPYWRRNLKYFFGCSTEKLAGFDDNFKEEYLTTCKHNNRFDEIEQHKFLTEISHLLDIRVFVIEITTLDCVSYGKLSPFRCSSFSLKMERTHDFNASKLPYKNTKLYYGLEIPWIFLKRFETDSRGNQYTEFCLLPMSFGGSKTQSYGNIKYSNIKYVSQ